MNLFLPATLLLSSSIFTASCFADVPTEQKPEVDHLINFVSTTECQLKRNFSYHSGEKAIAHIQKKYEHFRDEINTTEDFIRLSASKSLLTGKLYQVKCGDDELLESNAWLSAELKAHREKQTLTQPEATDKSAVVEPASVPEVTHTPKTFVSKLD